jgi:hypothetical protein
VSEASDSSFTFHQSDRFLQQQIQLHSLTSLQMKSAVILLLVLLCFFVGFSSATNPSSLPVPLILPSSTKLLADQYIIQQAYDTTQQTALSILLETTYSATILHSYTTAIKGFAVKFPDGSGADTVQAILNNAATLQIIQVEQDFNLTISEYTQFPTPSW